jgi:hypothetical protein
MMVWECGRSFATASKELEERVEGFTVESLIGHELFVTSNLIDILTVLKQIHHAKHG